MSPLLFALYVCDWGKQIDNSEVGFQLDEKVILGLFFADDMILMSNITTANNFELTVIQN